MNTRILGKTGARVSEVGLGTWQLGADWGNVDETAALAILHRAYDGGVTLFDTADVYGLGISERTIGRFLREVQGDVHVATKLGRMEPATSGGVWPERYTLQMAREACQRSCKNLGVDAIFLQQWHCPPTAWFRSGEIFDHMEVLKKEGLIQHWGCSVESVEEGLICMTQPDCASLQVIFNIFRQKLVTDLLPIAARNGVGILARVPLASGLLTGKFKKDHKFAADDHRNYNADGQAFNVGETFAGLPFADGVALADQVSRILPTDSGTMAQHSLRWVLDHPAVSAVIPGASRPDQVDANVATSALPPLSPGVHHALCALYTDAIAPKIRGPY